MLEQPRKHHSAAASIGRPAGRRCTRAAAGKRGQKLPDGYLNSLSKEFENQVTNKRRY